MSSGGGHRGGARSGSKQKQQREDAGVSDKGAPASVIPPFQFRRRTQRLNWMQITDTDVDRIERSNDTKSLLTLWENIVFSDLRAEGDYLNPQVVKLMRLSQMITEYIHYGQWVLQQRRDELKRSHDEMAEERDHYKQQMEKMSSDIRALRREVRRQKKSLASYEYIMEQQSFVGHKCRYCNKMFANNTYLHKHMEKRHPTELAEDGFEDFEAAGGAPHPRRRDTSSPPPPQIIRVEAPAASASPPVDVRSALEPLLAQQAADAERRIERIREELVSVLRERQGAVGSEVKEALSSHNQTWSEQQREAAQKLESTIDRLTGHLREDLQGNIQSLVKELAARVSESIPKEAPVMRMDEDEHPRLHASDVESLLSERINAMRAHIQQDAQRSVQQQQQEHNQQIAALRREMSQVVANEAEAKRREGEMEQVVMALNAQHEKQKETLEKRLQDMNRHFENLKVQDTGKGVEVSVDDIRRQVAADMEYEIEGLREELDHANMEKRQQQVRVEKLGGRVEQLESLLEEMARQSRSLPPPAPAPIREPEVVEEEEEEEEEVEAEGPPQQDEPLPARTRPRAPAYGYVLLPSRKAYSPGPNDFLESHFKHSLPSLERKIREVEQQLASKLRSRRIGREHLAEEQYEEVLKEMNQHRETQMTEASRQQFVAAAEAAAVQTDRNFTPQVKRLPGASVAGSATERSLERIKKQKNRRTEHLMRRESMHRKAQEGRGTGLAALARRFGADRDSSDEEAEKRKGERFGNVVSSLLANSKNQQKPEQPAEGAPSAAASGGGGAPVGEVVGGESGFGDNEPPRTGVKEAERQAAADQEAQGEKDDEVLTFDAPDPAPAKPPVQSALRGGEGSTGAAPSTTPATTASTGAKVTFGAELEEDSDEDDLEVVDL